MILEFLTDLNFSRPARYLASGLKILFRNAHRTPSSAAAPNTQMASFTTSKTCNTKRRASIQPMSTTTIVAKLCHRT